MFYFIYSLLSCLTYGAGAPPSLSLSLSGFTSCTVPVDCVTSSLAGISVASGLFIPSLLSGSALGRFIGEVLKVYGFNVDAGTFALIGALLTSHFMQLGFALHHVRLAEANHWLVAFKHQVLLPCWVGQHG